MKTVRFSPIEFPSGNFIVYGKYNQLQRQGEWSAGILDRLYVIII